MFKKTLLATTLVTFATTAAFAQDGETVKPQMTAEQVETYSTQDPIVGSSTAPVLMVFLVGILLIAVLNSSSPVISKSYVK